MRERKAARLLVISPSRDVLLFKFLHKKGIQAAGCSGFLVPLLSDRGLAAGHVLRGVIFWFWYQK